ncbi:MAG TPA: YIP1 family protein [Gammaproteobacteria bacterium]|nr:YIP1 family protein [Gammaproteobacteria bacterium]
MNASALACLVNIFVDPAKALTDAKAHTRWLWYPFVITLFVSVGFGVWYFLTVDLGWLVDQIVSGMAGKMDADQVDRVRDSMTRGRFLFGAVAGNLLGISAIYVLQAVYLLLVDKLGGSEIQSFGKWFSFTAWTYFPNVLATVATAVMYLFSPGKQVSLYRIDVTSVNTLLFHLPKSSNWFSILQNLHLTLFWTLGLMIFGFALWTRKSLGKSALIVLAPYVVIYGVIVAIKLA